MPTRMATKRLTTMKLPTSTAATKKKLAPAPERSKALK